MTKMNRTVNLMIAATTLFIAVSVFFAFQGFSIIRRTTTASGQDFLLQSTQYAAKIIQLSMENRHEDLNELGHELSTEELKQPNYLLTHENALPTLFTTLNNEASTLIYIDTTKKIHYAYHWDSKAHQAKLTPNTQVEAYVQKDPSLTNVLKNSGIHNGDAYFINKKSYINFYQPVLATDGTIQGYFVLPLNLQDFYKNFLQDFKLDYKGYPMIKNKNMQVIVHPVDQQIGLDIIEGRKKLFPTFDFSDLERLEAYQLSHDSGKLTYKSYWWDENKPQEVLKIGAFKWVDIGDAHWVVSINADYNERNDDILNYIIVLFCLLLLLLLLILIFSLFIHNFRKKASIEEENRQLIKDQKQQQMQHELELELYQRNKMETVGLLTTSIVHDMNNFLTPIIGNTELLLEEHADDTVLKEDLEEILKSAQKGKQLSSNVLRFSKVQAKNQEVVDLATTVAIAVQLITEIIPKSATISVAIQENLGTIKLEEIDLQNLIYNLVTNAYQAAKEVTAEPLITIRLTPATKEQTKQLLKKKPLLKKESHFVTLEIADNGPGIPLKLQKKIFRPFFTTKKADEGTGLGLFAVASIVAKYEWLLTLDSSPETGSHFFITFPVLGTSNSSKGINEAEQITD